MAENEANGASAPPRRRFLRFGLRTLLVIMTALCVWMGLTANRANRQQRAVDAFLKHGAIVNYDYQQDSPGSLNYDLRREPPGPKQLRRLVGDKYFVTPVRLSIGSPLVAEDGTIELLRDLPGLESLKLGPLGLTNGELSLLRSLTNLRALGFGDVAIAARETAPNFAFLQSMPQLTLFSMEDDRFGDEGLAHLAGATDMRQLFIQDTSVGDAGLAAVANMQKLQMLNLARTKVTDAGLNQVVGLQNLTYLCLIGTAVTDEGLEELAKIASLTEIELRGARVTGDGVEQLQRALPQCDISY